MLTTSLLTFIVVPPTYVLLRYTLISLVLNVCLQEPSMLHFVFSINHIVFHYIFVLQFCIHATDDGYLEYLQFGTLRTMLI